jgi:hypothetical protein
LESVELKVGSPTHKFLKTSPGLNPKPVDLSIPNMAPPPSPQQVPTELALLFELIARDAMRTVAQLHNAVSVADGTLVVSTANKELVNTQNQNEFVYWVTLVKEQFIRVLLQRCRLVK